MPIIINLFQKTAEEETLPRLILQGHHHPDTKTRQRQHTHKKKTTADITDEHRYKNPQHNISKQNLATHQKAYTP